MALATTFQENACFGAVSILMVVVPSIITNHGSLHVYANAPLPRWLCILWGVHVHITLYLFQFSVCGESQILRQIVSQYMQYKQYKQSILGHGHIARGDMLPRLGIKIGGPWPITATALSKNHDRQILARGLIFLAAAVTPSTLSLKVCVWRGTVIS